MLPLAVTRRAARVRLVAVVAVVALAPAAVACQPVKPPPPPPGPSLPLEYCAPAPPTDAAGYQAAFDALLDNNTAAWVANDGGLPFPVPLPAGRVVWFFGDTLLGLAPDGPVIPPLVGIASNGFVLQDGACFRPVTQPIPNPAPNEWIWPTDAVVDGSKLLVFGMHMRRTRPDVFGFDFLGVEVATFSLPGLQLLDLRELPVPLPDTPTTPTYGESVLVDDDGYLYAYGQVPTELFERNHYVARVLSDKLLDETEWEFWSDDDPFVLGDEGWVPDNPDEADPMLFDDGTDPPSVDEGPAAAFPIVANGPDSYLGSAFPIDAFSKDVIETWTGVEPRGPWILQGQAVDITGTHGPLSEEQLAYGGRVVFDVPGGPLALWSINHLSFDAILADPDLYKVWFAEPTLTP